MKSRNHAPRATLLSILLAACAAAVQAEDAPAPQSQETQATPSAPSVGPAPARRVERPSAAPGESKPIQTGSWLLYPELVVTGLHDDNVFATRANRVRDWAAIFSPSLTLRSAFDRHAAVLQAAGDFTRYDDQTAEDTDDFRLSAEGRYDIDDGFNIYGGARYLRDHEDRESADATNGISPTIYYNTRLYAGVFKQLDRFSLRLGGTWQDLDFRDVPFLSGGGAVSIINNDDRDRRRATLGLRVGYAFAPQTEGFVQIASDERRYRQTPDDLGFDRNSDGYRLLAGVRHNVARMLKAEVFGGFMHQDYDDSRLQDVSTPALGANVVWNATEATTLNLMVDRTVEETGLATVAGSAVAGASSYVNSYAAITADHRLTAALSLYGSLSFARSDYQGVDRTDDYGGAGIGAAYRVARWMIVDASYQYRELNSSAPDEDFRRNLFFLRLVFPLGN